MLKRIFWLLVLAGGGVLLWQWLRQRQNEFSDRAPQFAPPRSYSPAQIYEPPAAASDPDEAFAPAAPGELPASVDPPPAFAPAAPEAPMAPTHSTSSQQVGVSTPANTEPPAAATATPTAATAEPAILGYCMRCHAKRPIAQAHEEISESGRRAARGTCPVCGTNMFTFLAANDDERGLSEKRS